MEYAFTANIEGVDCHIRAFRDKIVPNERLVQHPHKHFFMEFHCIFDGQEQVSLPLQKKEYTLRPGQILMIPRETYHAVDTGDSFVKRLCFNFSVEEKQAQDSPIMEFFRTINQPELFENKNAMDIIAHYQSLDHSSPLFEQLQGALLLGVVLELFSNIPGKQIQNTLTCCRCHLIARMQRIAADVRGKQNVVQLKEGRIGIGLANVHVNSGACNAVIAKRFNQGVFIKNRAARCVDQKSGRLHQLDHLARDKTVCFRHMGTMKRNKIRLCHQRFQRYALIAKSVALRLGGTGGIKYLHAHQSAKVGYFAADAPHPHNAQRSALQ